MTINHSSLDWTFLERPQQLAQEIHQRHGITSLPVPVAEIARAEGAVVKYEPLASEGALTRTKAGYVLSVNEAAVLARRRYTIAHEIGHILCDQLTGTYPGTRYRAGNQGVGIEQEERFCQRFASFLLIPDWTITDAVTWEQISIDKLRAKAKLLQVSARTLLWRVLEQLPFEGGAIYFQIMGKPNAPSDLKLRVVWSAFPKTTKSYIAPYDAAPLNSAIHNALSYQHEALCLDDKLNFGSLRGKRNLLVKSFGQAVLAIVLPQEIDPAIFRCALQTVADGI